MSRQIDILTSLHAKVDAILRGNHTGWDAALSKLRDEIASNNQPQPAAEEEHAGLSWTVPLPHLSNVQRVVQAAGWGMLELEQIEQVLLADAAVIAVTTLPKVNLLSAQESAALLKLAEETWTDLQANNLGGFSDGNRPFWLLHAFKQVIETFGGRDVGLHHSQDELEAIGAIKPRG